MQGQVFQLQSTTIVAKPEKGRAVLELFRRMGWEEAPDEVYAYGATARRHTVRSGFSLVDINIVVPSVAKLPSNYQFLTFAVSDPEEALRMIQEWAKEYNVVPVLRHEDHLYVYLMDAMDTVIVLVERELPL